MSNHPHYMAVVNFWASLNSLCWPLGCKTHQISLFIWTLYHA